MSYESVILRHAASFHWNRQDGQLTELLPGSSEYMTIHSQVHQALVGSGRTISRIVRVKNLIDFGQFLVREQFLVCQNGNTKYFRVRRFISLNAANLQEALKYNLDPRRCNLSNLQFESQVLGSVSGWPHEDRIVLVVQVLTCNPLQGTIYPDKSLDYFIEYVGIYPEVEDAVMVNVRVIPEMGAFVHLLAYNNTEGMSLLSDVEDVEKCTERFGKAKTMNSILRHVTESDELLEELDPKTAWHFEEKAELEKPEVAGNDDDEEAQEGQLYSEGEQG
ncbi:hypothetical protein HUJ04_013361 [Dendroctonus ponderosae]|nr:hypothetical protein HUJ04_013361 [Dendroctonus ponderosae]